MMKKVAQIFQNDIDLLIQELVGTTPTPAIPEVDPSAPVEYYQLPVKHTKGGQEINEENAPWIVGHFAPGVALNATHPQGHDGVDLKAPAGSPIYPIASGEVIEANNYPKGGITLKISHEDGKVVSYYAHLESRNVSVGQKVEQTDIIGTVGDSGNAKGRGAHLHYEVKVDDRKIDPQSITGKRVGALSKKAEYVNNLMKSLDNLFDRKSVLNNFIQKSSKS